MHHRKRHTLPPWERRSTHRLHPTGRARRRWPRAYDGGTPEAEPNRRYQREFEGEQRVERRRSSRQRLALDSLRRSPVRNGLIGLAVVGTAGPVAVNQYQQAMRTDPAHERTFTQAVLQGQATDSSVTNAWRIMETKRKTVESERESVVEQKMGEYAQSALSRDLAEDIYDMARAANVDFDVAYGLVNAESSFKTSATSRVGAVGLTQLMPSTADWLEPGVTRSDLRDPETNLRIGFKYLRQLIDKYEGNVDLALTAYNRGPGTVDRALKRGQDPDNGYAHFVKTGDIGNHKG